MNRSIFLALAGLLITVIAQQFQIWALREAVDSELRREKGILEIADHHTHAIKDHTEAIQGLLDIANMHTSSIKTLATIR